MKKIIIILILILVVFIFLFYFLMLRLNQTKPDSTVITPTSILPTQYTVSPTAEKPLIVQSLIPDNEASDVPLNQEIIITFDRPLVQQEISFVVDPPFSYTTQINRNVFTITPKESLQPGVSYTYKLQVLSTNQLPYAYSFTTSGPTPLFLPDTQPKEEAQKENRYLLDNNPDIFLSNNCPFENEFFSIKTDFTTQPTGHFYFIVTLKGTDQTQSRNIATAWMNSLGLTDQQVKSLDITYN